MTPRELPIPPHFDPHTVDTVWPVPYQERAQAGEAWAKDYTIRPASEDGFRVCLMPVDVQNTFCIPGFELYVGGRSGRGAVAGIRGANVLQTQKSGRKLGRVSL